VLNQEERHRSKSFKDEYLAMLKQGLVEFDDRYVVSNVFGIAKSKPGKLNPDQPPFTPLRSVQKAASRPSRQKQIPWRQPKP